MTDKSFKQKLNSRKLFMAFAASTVATLLLLHGSIQAEHWVTVIITVVGAYMATQAYVDRT